MKVFSQITLMGLVILMFLTACTIQKRVHSRGYHVEWNTNRHSHKTNDNFKHKKQMRASDLQTATKNEMDSVITIVNEGNISASTNKAPIITEEKKFSKKIAKAKENDIVPKETNGKKELTTTAEDSLEKKKSLLSTLWIFVTLNYLYCDIAGLMDAALLSEYMAGVVGGVAITQGFLLAAGILMTIPISMVLLSRVLKGKGNRRANIIAGIIMTLVQIATLFAGPVAIYYAYFSVIEIATTAYITWYAWKKLPKIEA